MKRVVEGMKTKLLADLRLMTPADLRAYWKQAKWPKPDLVALSANDRVEIKAEVTRGSVFAPLRYAIRRLTPEMVAKASNQLDPFGWLLEAIDMTEWSAWCSEHRQLWMGRVWLAAASQLLAERSLIFKAHGWRDTWERIRLNPDDSRSADDFYFAQLQHSRGGRKAELLGIPVLDKRFAEARRVADDAFFRRFRRAKLGAGKRAGVSHAEKFSVQHWHELPNGFPGLCFFSDPALHDLLVAFGLDTGDSSATKQFRVRLGLVQAGAKRHLVEQVVDLGSKLRLMGSAVKSPWSIEGKLSWGARRLWPRPA